jgi:hypothetical protein
MSSHTINYSSDVLKRSYYPLDHNNWLRCALKDMHQALIDAATKTALVLPEPMPFVLQTSLDDFYVSYQIMRTLKKPTNRR